MTYHVQLYIWCVESEKERKALIHFGYKHKGDALKALEVKKKKYSNVYRVERHVIKSAFFHFAKDVATYLEEEGYADNIDEVIDWVRHGDEKSGAKDDYYQDDYLSIECLP